MNAAMSDSAKIATPRTDAVVMQFGVRHATHQQEAILADELEAHACQLERELAEAVDLLETCLGCDLIYDAWPAYGETNVVHGVTITRETTVKDLVSAFLLRRVSKSASQS